MSDRRREPGDVRTIPGKDAEEVRHDLRLLARVRPIDAQVLRRGVRHHGLHADVVGVSHVARVAGPVGARAAILVEPADVSGGTEQRCEMPAGGITHRRDVPRRNVIIGGPASQHAQRTAHVGDRGRKNVPPALRETVLHGRGRITAACKRAHLVGEALSAPAGPSPSMKEQNEWRRRTGLGPGNVELERPSFPRHVRNAAREANRAHGDRLDGAARDRHDRLTRSVHAAAVALDRRPRARGEARTHGECGGAQERSCSPDAGQRDRKIMMHHMMKVAQHRGAHLGNASATAAGGVAASTSNSRRSRRRAVSAGPTEAPRAE